MHTHSTATRALRAALLCLVAAASAASALAQATNGPTARPAPPTLCQAFDIDAGTVQALDLVTEPSGRQTFSVRLGNAVHEVELFPHDVRAPGFRLLVRDDSGLHQIPTPPSVTYRGQLANEPGSGVVATIIDGSVEATIYRAPDRVGTIQEAWIVQPVRQVVPQAGRSAHVVYRSRDTSPLPHQCGVTATAPFSTAPTAGVDVTVECDIAIEADVQFYQQNGSSTTGTQNDITSIMNQVEFIYDRDCDVQFDIATIIVTTTNVYTTNSSGTLLSQFRSRWQTVHGGVARDVAHLFTGRNLSGSTIGVAYLSGICSNGTGYGLSQSRFTSNFNARVALTAHELGHNFSSNHCSGGGCNIMCAGLGGCSGNVTQFSSGVANTIRNYAQNRPCLTPIQTQPVITSASPTSVPAFRPGLVTLTGSGFTGTTSFTVAGQTFTSGFFVVDDDTLRIAMPTPTALGVVTVSATNPLGTSNTFPVTYVTTSPTDHFASPSIPPSGGIAEFGIGGQPGQLWFVVLSLNNSTAPFQGLPLLQSQIVLGIGVLDPLGLADLTVPVPAGLGLLQVYSQALEADITTLQAIGTSTVRVSFLL